MNLGYFRSSVFALLFVNVNVAVDLTESHTFSEGALSAQAPLSSTSTNSCPLPSVVSCSSDAVSTDSCCVLKPGGSLVHAQFWDRDVGQPDSWGIHGLWPDTCDGAFYENCDASRAYSGAQIVQALHSAGEEGTLMSMHKFWLSNDDPPEIFWEHEWGTHGTCVSTLEPRCFEGYQIAQEVVPYFKTVVSLFQTLNTYDALAQANITPSWTRTYILSDLQEAVYSYTGYTPIFACSGTTLKSVEYFLRVQGPLQNGVFVRFDPDSSTTAARNLVRGRRGCPDDGIVYSIKDSVEDGKGSLQQNGGQPTSSRDEF